RASTRSRWPGWRPALRSRRRRPRRAPARAARRGRKRPRRGWGCGFARLMLRMIRQAMGSGRRCRYNEAMNKAFVKESSNDHDREDDDAEALALAQAIPAGAKNYITPAGYQAIKDELLQ